LSQRKDTDLIFSVDADHQTHSKGSTFTRGAFDFLIVGKEFEGSSYFSGSVRTEINGENLGGTYWLNWHRNSIPKFIQRQHKMQKGFCASGVEGGSDSPVRADPNMRNRRNL